MRITYKISFKKFTGLIKSIKAKRLFRKETGIRVLPSKELRFNVHGSKDLYSFLDVGKRCANDINVILEKNGMGINSFKNILDFGCGCGRTLIYLNRILKLVAEDNPRTHDLCGTDIDAEAISYCQGNIPFAKFDTNDVMPPLRYSSGSFDLVYAISVFSHLNEEYNIKWMEELGRIIKTKGILLISINGMSDEGGFIFSQSNFWRSIFPEWYGDANISRRYIRDRYSRHFKMLDYISKGVADNQDMVMLQRV